MGGESIGTNRSTSGSTGRLAPTTETNGLPEKNKVRRKRGGGGRGEKTSSSGSPGKKASADSKAGVRNQDDRLDNNDSDALAIQSRGRTGKRSEQGTQRPVLRSPKVVADNGKGSSRGSTRKRGGRKNLATENGTENSSEAANASKKSSKRSHTKSKRKVVVRRLPAGFTEEDARGTLASFDGSYGLFYFVKAAKGLKTHSFARFYIEFKNIDSVRAYSQFMSTAHLADGDGNPIMPVVEFAPNQSNGLLQSKTKRSAGNPNASKGKSRKADYRANTLETDKDYLAFLEVLSAEREEIYNANLHTESDKPKVDSKEVVATPLLDFIKTIKSSRKGGSGTGSSDKRSNRRSEKTGTSSTSQSSSSTTKKRRERDPEKREDQKVYKVKRSTRPSGDGEKRASNKKSAFGGDLTAETSKGDTAVRGSTSSPVKKKERKRRSDRATGETEASAGDGPGNGKERHTSSSTSSSSKRRSNRDPASTGGSSRGAATSATAPGGATDSTTKKTSKPPSAASAESRAKSSKSGSGSGSRSRRGGGGSANKTSSNPPA